MARVKVKFIIPMTAVIEWPDDELGDLNYDNLCANLDVDTADHNYEFEVLSAEIDGEELEFMNDNYGN